MDNGDATGIWVPVIQASALREGTLTPVFPKGLPVLLVRSSGGIHALANRCPHLGCPLARGRLDGFILQCPCHDWLFDIRTGAFLNAPEISLPLYEWKIEAGEVHIKLEKAVL